MRPLSGNPSILYLEWYLWHERGRVDGGAPGRRRRYKLKRLSGGALNSVPFTSIPVSRKIQGNVSLLMDRSLVYGHQQYQWAFKIVA
jgi:hypothetical protein